MNIPLAEYFARQTTMPEIGLEGLNKLQSFTIGIAGVGGVGSAAAYYLAKSGVGRLRLVDQDIVEQSNLQRLHASTPMDLYQPKAETVSRAIASLETGTVAEPIVETITDGNVDKLFENVDLVFDGLDNFRTRYILNNHALRSQTRYVFASAVAQQAHIMILNPPKTPCLECVMPRIIDRIQDSCENLGVTPTITGLVGALGATVVTHALIGSSSKLNEQMMTIDLAGPEFLFYKLSRRTECEACSSLGRKGPITSSLITSLCGEHTANVLPRTNLNLKLSNVSVVLPPEKILLKTNSVLVFQYEEFRVSLFPNGRLLIGGIDEEAQASRIADDVWRAIRGM